jgi:hypothetical protein
MNNPETIFNGMMIFYLIIAIVALTTTIIVRPTLFRPSHG